MDRDSDCRSPGPPTMHDPKAGAGQDHPDPVIAGLFFMRMTHHVHATLGQVGYSGFSRWMSAVVHTRLVSIKVSMSCLSIYLAGIRADELTR